jgi:hypothetical protein
MDEVKTCGTCMWWRGFLGKPDQGICTWSPSRNATPIAFLDVLNDTMGIDDGAGCACWTSPPEGEPS